jgi:hypothetical protein
MMTEQQREQYLIDGEWLRNEKWTPLSTHGARLFGGNTALNISGSCADRTYEDEGANMAQTGEMNLTYKPSSSTGGDFLDWRPYHEYTPIICRGNLVMNDEWPNDLRKENDGMETYLTDLVLAMGLNKAELGEIREIMKQGASSWQPRFLLYLLALWVQSNGLTLEDLGYEREE